jgi:GxxExxY protein
MKLLILTQKIDMNDDVLGFFHGWVAEFAKSCEQITVICLKKGENDLPANVKVLSLGKEKLEIGYWKLDIIKKLKYGFNFFRYLWQERKNYDAVFVHMNQIYVILGGLVWKSLGKKIGLWYTHGAVGLSLRLAEKMADLIFTATSDSFRLKSNKVKVLGHGIDTDKFRGGYARMEERILADGGADTRGEQLIRVKHEFLYSDLTYKIRGSCFKVWKEFRGAFKEKIIERALIKEIIFQGLDVETQKQIPIFYRNEKIGAYVPDLIVENKVLIELKSKPFLTKEDERQFWLYLQGSEYKLGLLINFGKQLEIKRRIYDKARNNANGDESLFDIVKEQIDSNSSQTLRESAFVDHQRSSAFRVISVGRISPSKDYETLILAIEAWRAEHPDKPIEVEVIGAAGTSGQEAYFESLKKMVAEKNLGKIIRFSGAIPNRLVASRLEAADVFVNMSHTGGLDKAVLEAMASGLPVITCNETFTAELGDLSQSLMFEKKDVKGLIGRLEYIMSLDKEERQTLGERLREIVVARHNLDLLIKKIIEQYTRD